MALNLTPQQVAALEAFAAGNGKGWKEKLACVYWYNARIWIAPDGTKDHGTTLHGLRNMPGGHAALENFKTTGKA